MSIYIFIGPTISIQEAKEYCKAYYLPPVAQGDIIRLLREGPKVIGIIDGYFNSVPSVWHKEILLALSRGVHVIGGASMGALRAAELHSFGMRGIGGIYQSYRDGSLEADDEVAVVHAGKDFDYRPFSEAMVNIRATLKAALDINLINKDSFQSLIEIARGLYYRERTYKQILEKGLETGIPLVEIENLKIFLVDHKENPKKEDAIKVLQYIDSMQEHVHPKTLEFDLQHTTYLEYLLDREQSIFLSDEEYVTYEELVNHARLEWDDFPDIIERAASNLLILSLAHQQGVTLSGEEVKEDSDMFLEKHGVAQENSLQWAKRNDLKEDEFGQIVNDWLLIQKMKSQEYILNNRRLDWKQIKEGQNEELLREAIEAQKYRFGNRVLVWQLKIEGRYEDLLREAIETQKKAYEVDDQLSKSIDFDKLKSFYIAKMQLKEGANVFSHAAEIGFETRSGFLLALLKSYLVHNTS